MKKSISGIRGIFGKDLILKDVLQFCKNFSLLIKSKKCVIGMDTRPSSNMMKETVCASLMQCGIDVYDLGMAPTPVVFRESRKIGAGIVVTSSHNPTKWNGLKFIIEGRGINEDELQVVLNNQTIPQTKIGIVKKIDSDYVNDAVNLIGNINTNPSVSIDIGGGAARYVAPELLKKLGCKVQTINEDINNSSRGPDPTADNLSELILNTKDKEIGFAFDLDADRLVIVKDGKKQTSDVTLGLGVAKALEFGYKKFVLSIDSSIGVENYIIQHGGIVQRSKVGEANVIDLMLKTKSQAGGEGSSAGFILPEFNYCRDGLLTSGLIISMIGSKTFDDTIKFMENYFLNRTKIEIPSKLHDKTIERLNEKMAKQYSEIITIDGIKGIVDENSWVLVRKSNTEDIIRISTESNDAKKAESIQRQVSELVKQSYEQIR